MIKQIQCIVHGDVQGVFFRDFAKKKSDERGIVGYVENLSDGTVKLVAEGEIPKLQEYISSISAGPENAEVSDIDIKWDDAKNEYTDFKIIQ